MGLDGFECGRTVRRRDDREALALEVGPDETDDLGVVVDNQDGPIRGRWGGPG